MRHYEINILTNGSGAFTGTVAGVGVGLLYAVQWVDGDLADGVGAVLSVASAVSAVDDTLLTLTAANADKWYYPRVVEHGNTGSDLTTYALQVVTGALKVVVSSGGDAKSGAVHFWLIDA